jgi:hypothetical protein
MADSNDAALAALARFHSDFVSLVEKGIAAEERMHSASLEAQQALLTTALKGAENCPPEQFAVLVSALKEVTVASIQAEREVALVNAENGRAAIKMLDNALQGAIQVGGQVAAARLQQLDRRVAAEEVRAAAKANAARAEKIKAEKLAEKLKDFKASA